MQTSPLKALTQADEQQSIHERLLNGVKNLFGCGEATLIHPSDPYEPFQTNEGQHAHSLSNGQEYSQEEGGEYDCDYDYDEYYDEEEEEEYVQEDENG